VGRQIRPVDHGLLVLNHFGIRQSLVSHSAGLTSARFLRLCLQSTACSQCLDLCELLQVQKELPRGFDAKYVLFFEAKRTLGSQSVESFGELLNHCCQVELQMIWGLVLGVAEAAVVGRQEEEDELVWLLFYFQQTPADGLRYCVPLVWEFFAGTWRSQMNSRADVVGRAESTAAVEPAIVAPRQDRNIRKGRQSWAEVVETMLLRRWSIGKTICL
jgi:hypothetical protein